MPNWHTGVGRPSPDDLVADHRPIDPDILFAGTRPAGIYRTRDEGRQWEKFAVKVAWECSLGTPFVTSVIVDPDDHRLVWAEVEIDGVFSSVEGGDTWQRLNHDLLDLIEVDLAVLACPVGFYGRSPASNC